MQHSRCPGGAPYSRYTVCRMRVRVLFFGVLKDLAGKSADEIELREGSRVSDILQHYRTQAPEIGNLFSSIALAVNQQYAGPDTILKASDEVALLPPVSGGTAGAAGETNAIQPTGRGRYASIIREMI